MAYITKADYEALSGAIETAEFDRLAYDASRFMDRMTTGIDNVKKLKTAMPTDSCTQKQPLTDKALAHEQRHDEGAKALYL